MARFKKRADYEAELAKRVGKAGREAYGEVIDALGETPDMAKLTPEFWEGVANTYRAAVQTAFEGLILACMTQRMKEQGISFDWATINARAAEWARNYSFELVKGINENTRKALQQKIAGFYEDKRTLAELKQSIGELFGPVRAEMIAVTETTRAASGGEQMFADELRALGLQTQSVVQTSNDELVCPICGPKNGKPTSQEGHPPFHPRCRCGESTEVIEAAI